jgi:hypothetical protein
LLKNTKSRLQKKQVNFISILELFPSKSGEEEFKGKKSTFWEDLRLGQKGGEKEKFSHKITIR